MAINDPQIKKDTRRDAWDRDYLPLDRNELEEATKIEPKKDYAIWIFVFFFIAILVMIGNIK